MISQVELSTADAWERYAADWVAWAEPENQDGFWTATWPTLATMLPLADGLVLDLGCGEGRALRLLKDLGYATVGLDRSPTLVRAAAAGGSRVVLADAAQLPLRDGSVSLVLASMSLLDIDDVEAAIGESYRVLTPGGVLLAAIVHPFISTFDPTRLHDGELVVAAPYRTQRSYVDEVTRNGRTMTFCSVHRPLRDYLGEVFRCGFVLTDLREEGDGPIPWLLAFSARRPDAD